jgi:hypothetical protein
MEEYNYPCIKWNIKTFLEMFDNFDNFWKILTNPQCQEMHMDSSKKLSYF